MARDGWTYPAARRRYIYATQLGRALSKGMKMADAKKVAIEKAGMSENSISKINTDVMKNKYARNRFLEALDEEGLTFEAIAKKLKGLMKCERMVKVGKDDFASNPDNFVQHQATNTVMKAVGAFPSTKIDINKRETKMVITVDALKLLENYGFKMVQDEVIDAES